MDGLLAAQEQHSARRQDQVTELQRAEDRLQALILEEREAQQRSDRAGEEALSLEQRFGEQLGEWGLPPTLSSQGAEEYVRSVAAAKEDLVRLGEDRAALARIEGEIAAWKDEAARLVEQAGLSSESQGEPDVEPALLSLADACRQEAERRRRLTVIEDAATRA